MSRRLGWLHASVALALALLVAYVYRQGTERHVCLIFNLFEGSRNNASRLAGIEGFVRSHKPAVLALNELNGWNAELLASFGRRIGLNRSFFLQTPWGYHLGLLAREGSRLRMSSAAAPFHHGVLGVDLAEAEVTVLLTHLSPLSSIARRAEAKGLCELRRAAAAEGKAVLLVGDLNSVAASDAPSHAGLCEHSDRLRRKFCGGGVLDLRPHELLEECGLADLGRPGDWTVPTMYEADPLSHVTRLRLDYAMADTAFRERHLPSDAVAVKSDATAALSDHYPLVFEYSSAALGRYNWWWRAWFWLQRR